MGRGSSQHGESKMDVTGADTVVFGGEPLSSLNRHGYLGGAIKVWCKTIERFIVYYHCKVHGWVVDNFGG
eukprot:scaffold60816_cov96-Cyclotella_meneghiniana.AAC.1